jgi:cytochrome c oxidase subunit III
VSAASQAVRADSAGPRTLGMWIFLGSEVLFFGALIAAYLAGRVHWPEGFAAASRHTHVWLGTLNTAVLLTSSALIALAVACTRNHGHRHWTARLLWATAALGAAFLAIKGYEYAKEWHEHLFPGPAFPIPQPGAQQFFMLYFLMTSLHGVHVICGVVAVGLFARASGQRRGWAQPERIDALALYWHFVDIVWIFLYPFLYLLDRHS